LAIISSDKLKQFEQVYYEIPNSLFAKMDAFLEIFSKNESEDQQEQDKYKFLIEETYSKLFHLMLYSS
jgi:hypothetical protein